MKPWTERFADLYEEEREHWIGRGFTEEPRQASGEVRFTGDISISVKPGEGPVRTRTFRVRVVYPAGYPHDAPDVEFIDPPIKRSRHMAAGQPCLYPPRAWVKTIPASEIERKIEDWLRGYELNSFPREIPVYELPAYYGYARPTILMSAKTLPSMAGRDHGRFAVQEFEGYDLAVLLTVDREEVGKSLAGSLGLPKSVVLKKENGVWFRLSEAPPPVQNERELQAVLGRSGHSWQVREKPGRREFVGLIFEDEHLGEEQWLMLDYGGAGKKARRPIHDGWALRSPRTHLVGPEELFKRLQGVRDVAALDQRLVTVFGLGAIGSHAALALARDGIGVFRLGDPDRLRPGNVMRHALDVTAAGQYKADAVANAIYRTNPFAEVESITRGLDDPSSLEQHYRGADVVLAAIGEDEKEELLTEIAVTGANRAPVLVARTLHAGAAVRLMLVRPGRDACMTCLYLHKRDGHPDWIEVPESDLPETYDEGCATPSSPGAGIASQTAALLAAERILSLLEERDDDENHWLHVREPILNADARLAQPGLYAASLPIHPECPWCGSP